MSSLQEENGSKISSSNSLGVKLPQSFALNHGLDTIAVQMKVHGLKSKNCVSWAQSIKQIIYGKGWMGYVLGEATEPVKTDPKWPTWKSENSLVISRFFNFMEPLIGKAYLLLPLAKDVWEAVRKTYSALKGEGPNSSKTVPGATYFIKEQLDKLYEFFQSTQFSNFSSASFTCSLAPQGNYLRSMILKASNLSLNPWIIDSGATDHMTGSSRLFFSYFPCAGDQKVKIADGSLSAIAGKGSVLISKNLVLHNVLHDLDSGKTIGNARESGGLYYCEEEDNLYGQAQQSSVGAGLSIRSLK
ncbi:uncharacterized protein [Henckelia pumila]|uniref:uncharacterized protein isoform X3 n=1 Tax=Henckelia pumila TaxID=405737 RepID=UPI003C6E4219